MKFDHSKIYKHDGAWHYDLGNNEKVSSLFRDLIVQWLIDHGHKHCKEQNEDKTTNGSTHGRGEVLL